MPIKKGTLQFIQRSHRDTVRDAIVGMIGKTYDNTKVYVLYGCEVSISGSNVDFTEGAVFYAEEVFEVLGSSFTLTGGHYIGWALDIQQYTNFADPVTFSDGNNYNVHNIRRYKLLAVANGGSNKPLASDTVFYGVWQARNNVSDVAVVSGTGTVSSSQIRYKIDGNMVTLQYSVDVNLTGGVPHLEITLPVGFTAANEFDVIAPAYYGGTITKATIAAGSTIIETPVLGAGTNTLTGTIVFKI